MAVAKKKLALTEWIPKEEAEQEAIFAWAELLAPKYPALAMLSASMNGILTDARFGAKLKRLGRKRGFPDLFLAVPKRHIDGNMQCGSLFIELKRKKGGVVSPEQKWWHVMLRGYGYQVEVCHGAQEAIAVIKTYLGIQEK